MKCTTTKLPGVLIIEPEVHRDPRGLFLETYHQRKYHEAGIEADFVQDNYSRSTRGTVRGLHLQVRPPQGKLVRVSRGLIFDVAVDVRRQSPTFGSWVGVELSGENFRQMYIPPGYAHGFCVLSDVAEVEYKCTDLYNPAGELSIRWDDPGIRIPWPVDNPILSEKDRQAPALGEVMERLPLVEEMPA